MPPTWEWVDVSAEQQSSEAAIKANQSTLQIECGAKGLNYKHVLYQRAKEEALARKLGLSTPAEIESASVQAGSQGVAGADKAAELALNGAQVTSLVDIVTQIATGAMPKDTAKAVMASAFPAFDEAKINQIVDPIVPGSVSAEGVPAANTAATSDVTGEFAGLTTMQFNRNRKAIDKVLSELAAGTTTEAKARVFLSSIGMKPESIDMLIADAMDGSVDSLPAEGVTE
jgi:hypothetical protein